MQEPWRFNQLCAPDVNKRPYVHVVLHERFAHLAPMTVAMKMIY